MCIELVEHERRFFHLLDTLGQYTALPGSRIHLASRKLLRGLVFFYLYTAFDLTIAA